MNVIQTLISRNIEIIEQYRLKCFFHIKHHFVDYIFSKNAFSRAVFKLYFRIFSIAGYFLNQKLSLASIDFNLTTSCSLNCAQCASMIPYYDSEHQWTINFEQFKSDLDKFLVGINKIYRLKLIGGEPLLVDDLDKMLEYACRQKNIVSIEITTNGTIIPSDEVCNLLKKYKTKTVVVISDYSDNKKLKNLKNTEIIKKLNQYGAYYHISKYEWFEIGDIYAENRNTNEIKTIFKTCWQKDCTALMDGKIHHCTRSAAIQRLTDYKFPEGEFIDIREESSTNIAKKIRKFFTKDCYKVCDFCRQTSDIRITPAIQTNDTLKIKHKPRIT